MECGIRVTLPRVLARVPEVWRAPYLTTLLPCDACAGPRSVRLLWVLRVPSRVVLLLLLQPVWAALPLVRLLPCHRRRGVLGHEALLPR